MPILNEAIPMPAVTESATATAIETARAYLTERAEQAAQIVAELTILNSQLKRNVLRWVGQVPGQCRPPMSESFAELKHDGLITHEFPGAWAPADAYKLTPLGERVLSAALERGKAQRTAENPGWSRCPGCGAMAQLSGLETCGCE